VDAFLSGIFWPGIALSSFNLLLVSAREENRAAYLAVFTTITGVTGFLASLLGGTLATLFSFFIWKIGPVTLLNFHILFLLSALGRVAVLFFMPKVKEAKAKPLAEMMRFLTDYMIRRFSLGSGQNQPG
jgi:MFS family permease